MNEDDFELWELELALTFSGPYDWQEDETEGEGVR